MAERDKIRKYFQGSGDEELAAKLIDLAERAKRSNTFRVTEFLDPHEQNTAKIVAANFPDIALVTDGGFPNAERVKAAFVSDGFRGVPDFGIAAYLVAWDKRYYDLGHRDVLGAFMGMGCRREILGDIVFVPEVGKLYYGRVVRLMQFGAFVEIAPGKDGLVHISKLDRKRVEKVEDVVTVGDMIWVKFMEIDEKGRWNLSRKDALIEIEAQQAAAKAAEQQ